MLTGIKARMVLGLGTGGNLCLIVLFLASVGLVSIPCHWDSLLWGSKYYRMC